MSHLNNANMQNGIQSQRMMDEVQNSHHLKLTCPCYMCNELIVTHIDNAKLFFMPSTKTSIAILQWVLRILVHDCIPSQV